MKCPKCDNDMREISDVSFSAMKCNGCAGIWFRDGSHEIARAIEGSEAIDDGYSSASVAYNEVRDISCPECRQKMIKMVDRDQLRIEFESCTYCKGVFFDAGEFADFSEYTLLERVKRAIATLKSNIRT